MLETEDEIRIRLALETQSALDNIKKVRTEINILKEDVISFSQQAQTSLEATAKGMLKTFAEQRMQATKTVTLKEGQDPGEALKKANAAAKAAIAEYRTNLTAAVGEIKQAEASEFQAVQVQAKEKQKMAEETAKIEKQMAVDAMKFKEAQIKQQILLEKEAAKYAQITFKPDTAAVSSAAAQLRTQIDEIKKSLTEISTQSGTSFKESGKALVDAAQKAGMAGEQLKQFKANVSSAVTELSKAQAPVQNLTSSLVSLGRAVLSVLGIYSLVQVIRSLINGFQQLVTVGEEYAQTIYRLGVATNQLQRRGLDITVKSQIELIKELSKEYSTFSTKSIVSAVASVEMLTRNFGFSQEQIKKTTQLSMDLALVQGKDVAETAKQLALFYSSGYGEGLQHAGLAVNRMTVAQEAQREGLKKTYMQLTEVERAQAAYNLVTRQSEDLHKDAVKIQDYVTGQIKAQKAAIENVTNEIALRALPIELAWLKVKLALIKAMGDQITLMDAMKEVAKEQGQEELLIQAPQEFAAMNREAIEKKRKEMQSEWEKQFNMTLDVPVDLGLDINSEDADQAIMDKKAALGDKIMGVWEDLQQAQEDYSNDSIKLEEDYTKSLEDIDKDALKKRADLWKNYNEDILKIQRDLAKTIADAEADLSQTISDAQTKFNQKNLDDDRKYQDSIAEENRKFQETEYKDERDHQERLKRLKEDYLFALEDALRERDALQVLQLQRRYAQDKKRENEDYKIRRADAAREHKQRLQDLAKQHAEEERQARESLEREIADAKAAEEKKIADAKAAAAQKLADARAAYQQGLADAAANAEEEKKAAAEKYAEQQAELDKNLADRLSKILKAFGKEIGVTGDSLKDVSSLFRQYLGQNGVVDGVIDQYMAILSAAAEATSSNVEKMMADLARLKAVSDSLPNGFDVSTLGEMGQVNQPSYHASGISMVATRPKTFVAGEVPEMINVTPLSQYNTGKLNGKGGQADINVWLSPGLEAEITNNTLQATAKIMKKEFGKRK